MGFLLYSNLGGGAALAEARRREMKHSRLSAGGAAVLWLVASPLLAFAPAAASNLPAAYCSGGATTSGRPLPPSLVAAAAQALAVDAALVRTGAYYRCSAGRLLVCAVGANLWCGKAETDIRPPSVVAYCRRNPDAALAPMATTGHATIHAWRCVNGAPQVEPTSMAVDSAGYIADNWRELD